MKKLIEISSVDITIYKFLLPLMDALKKQGWDISIASSDCGYRNAIRNKGYNIHDISIPRTLSPLKNINALLQLIKLLKREKPYCIHTHTPIASIISRIAAKITKVPVVIYTLHGLYKKEPFLSIEKFMCKYFTDYIFTVCEADRRYLVDKRFIHHSRVKNINSVGIDTDIFNPKTISYNQKQNLKKELNIKDIPTIGFVGRLVKEKGIIELIDVFIKVNSKISCQLLIIGSSELNERDSKTSKIIVDKLDKNNLKNKVILAGHRDDIPLCLSVMDIFVLPSYREGMPVSILEAMSMELPVIATNIRGCNEEITPETGILVNLNDLDDLYNAILKLIYNKNLSVGMGIQARKRVKMHFSSEQSVKKQMEIFNYIKSKEDII